MPVPWTQLDIHIPACSLLLQRSKCLFTELLHIFALPRQFDSHHVSTSALPFMSWHYWNRESLISRSTEHILLLEDRMSATTTCAMSMDHLELKWLQGSRCWHPSCGGVIACFEQRVNGNPGVNNGESRPPTGLPDTHSRLCCVDQIWSTLSREICQGD